MPELNLRLPARRSTKAGPRDAKPARNHALLITTLAVSAGMVSAFGATSATGPFTSLHQHPQSIALTSRLVHKSLPATPIDAGLLFPPSPIVQKVVDIYDLPPVRPAVVAPTSTHGGGGDGGEGRDEEGRNGGGGDDGGSGGDD